MVYTFGMKKLLFLILLSPLANADMDYVCDVVITKNGVSLEQQIKDKGCERNNILNIYVDNKIGFKVGRFVTKKAQLSDMLTLVSSQWCRFDRNITLVEDVNETTRSLSCVLYSDKPRTLN